MQEEQQRTHPRSKGKFRLRFSSLPLPIPSPPFPLHLWCGEGEREYSLCGNPPQKGRMAGLSGKTHDDAFCMHVENDSARRTDKMGKPCTIQPGLRAEVSRMNREGWLAERVTHHASAPLPLSRLSTHWGAQVLRHVLQHTFHALSTLALTLALLQDTTGNVERSGAYECVGTFPSFFIQACFIFGLTLFSPWRPGLVLPGECAAP